MREISIFRAEQEAGLADKIRASATFAFDALPELSSKFEVSQKCLAHIVAKTNKTQGDLHDFDLHYLKTILATPGWNKNDDVFDRQEIWAARHTPEDKPFNYEHNCADIIGHMTDNYVLDDEGKLLAEDTLVDDLPAKFHIVAGAVLYKVWEKPELQERMDKILKEIAENKWFVSMESLFRGFDYAVVAEDGTGRVIARNEETAFLTKHLRIYGGDGKYENMRVGRLLRNIVFSGKGLVRKPANPASVILTQAENFTYAHDLVYSTSARVPLQKGEVTMANEIESLQQAIKTLQSENEKLQATARENEAKQLKAIQDEKVKADEALKVANEKIATLEKTISETAQASADELKKLQASLDEAIKQGKASADELQKIQNEQKHLSRIAAVKAVLKVLDTDAEAVKAAEDLATSLAELSDEKFEAHIQAVAKFTPAPIAPKQTPAKDAPKQTNKPAPMSGKATEEDPAEAQADTKVLDSAVAEETPALAVNDNTSVEVENVRKSIASYFGCEQADNEE